MAEKSDHHVVEKSLSGGDASPSDVPASTNDKFSAGGDVGEFKDTAQASQTQTQADSQQINHKMNDSDSATPDTGAGKDTTRNSTNVSERAMLGTLHLNVVAELGLGYL